MAVANTPFVPPPMVRSVVLTVSGTRLVNDHQGDDFDGAKRCTKRVSQDAGKIETVRRRGSNGSFINEGQVRLIDRCPVGKLNQRLNHGDEFGTAEVICAGLNDLDTCENVGSKCHPSCTLFRRRFQNPARVDLDFRLK